jgi:uncharacterized UBP type Zn finger protein
VWNGMIYETMQANSELYTDNALNAAFYELTERMRVNTKNGGTVNPSHLHNMVCQQWQQFQGYGQQDSHELLRLLMDQLAEECRDEAHFVKKLFSGRLASLVVCDACYNVLLIWLIQFVDYGVRRKISGFIIADFFLCFFANE